MARVPPPGDTLSFQANHALLNPHFESYKLAPPPVPPRSYPLPHPFRLPQLPDHARLGYHEVAARARHNHLAAGLARELVYVDGDRHLVAISVHPQTAHPTVHPLLRLPDVPVNPASSLTTRPVPEYPTALAVAHFLWCVTDGYGRLYLVRIHPASASAAGGVPEDVTSPWTASIEAVFEPRDDDNNDDGSGYTTPFRLHAVEPVSPLDGEEAIVLLSVVDKTSPPAAAVAPVTAAAAKATTSAPLTATTRHTVSSTTRFTYLSARISLVPATSSPTQTPQRLVPTWRLTSRDLPSFVLYDRARRAFAIGAGSKLVRAVAPSSSRTQASEEEKQEQDSDSDLDMEGNGDDNGEDVLMTPARARPVVAGLGGVSARAGTTGSGPARPRPRPFSWMQDKDSVTVAFPIPSDTPTSAIRITLSKWHVTLLVACSAASAAGGGGVVGLPRVSHKRLWADIDPHTSVWTFDREAEGRNSTYGMLTLHLEKSHAGTRWSDVFAATAPRPTDGAEAEARIEELDPELEYEDVPETLDPSELASITEQMEQWAQGLVQPHGLGPSSAADGDGGFGSGIPTSLTGNEIDVEVDAESGRPFVLTWVVDESGTAPTSPARLVHPHAAVPYELLTTPFPLAASAVGRLDFEGITVKHDVDGLLFTPPTSSSKSYEWHHASTFPALAFVLATKRDTRYVHHLLPTGPANALTSGAVLAFDAPALTTLPTSGSTHSGARTTTRDGANCFVYLAPPTPSSASNTKIRTKTKKPTTGTQMVLRVGGPGAGALVGVAAVELEGGERAVVALCENEVIIVRVFAAGGGGGGGGA